MASRSPIGNRRALERFVAQSRNAREGYLTLARVDADRRERQVEHVELSRHRPDGWLRRLVTAKAKGNQFLRLRLRRWGPGGQPRGSVTFTIGTPPAKLPPSANEPHSGGGSVAQELADLRSEHAAALERIEVLESVVQRMLPVVKAAEQVLLALGSDDPSGSNR